MKRLKISKNLNKKALIILLITVILLILGNVKPVYAEGTAFTLSAKSKDVVLNGNTYLSYSGGTGNVTWTSSDPTVVTVENGAVHGLKIGTATITATRGGETDTCVINVVYRNITIGGNSGDYVSSVNLVLNEHNTEKLKAKVDDDNMETVQNASVSWSSSDTSIVTVNNTGTITAIKAGTATITASAAGVTKTCEVRVYEEPQFTDFSKAKYEHEHISSRADRLKITGVDFKNTNSYYYIITDNSEQPNLVYENGSVKLNETQKLGVNIGILDRNEKKNCMYTFDIAQFTELNKDLYLWVVEAKFLNNSYVNEKAEKIIYATKFVVDGEKLEKEELPQLNLIIQNFSIGVDTEGENYKEWIHFNFPSAQENRKFTLKIGKVTDNSILAKIQNGNYLGITELLKYAKTHDAIYNQGLVTTENGYYENNKGLFNGRELLENKAYYYIYVNFDDENGKYRPIEGVTLGQAWISDITAYWNLWAHTDKNFKWENLTTTDMESIPADISDTPDTTVASGKLPQTGIGIGLISTLTLGICISVFTYLKYRRLKDI